MRGRTEPNESTDTGGGHDEPRNTAAFRQANDSAPIHWARFAADGVIVLAIILLSFSPLTLVLEPIGVGLSPDLMISLAIVAFVIVMEIWIWLMRLRVKSGLR